MTIAASAAVEAPQHCASTNLIIAPCRGGGRRRAAERRRAAAMRSTITRRSTPTRATATRTTAAPWRGLRRPWRLLQRVCPAMPSARGMIVLLRLTLLSCHPIRMHHKTR
eukprot:scaffold63815_cov32-Tisochrysis_lutea.AAC.4